jgi:hypothetical protein
MVVLEGLIRDAEFWLDTVLRCPRWRKRAHIPVAQTLRPGVCSCCGVVVVGAKTLTPGRGELQNPSAHVARKLPACRRVLPAPDISLLMGRESFAKIFSTPDTASGWRGIACWPSFSRNWARSHREVQAPHLQLALKQSDAHWHSRHANHAGRRSAFTAGCARLRARHERV